jgi:16S rRNA (uracil1498-N3)-methyltransferase
MLDDTQAHYLIHVLRLSDDEVVRLFNASNGEWTGKFRKSGKHKAEIHLDTQTRIPLPEADIWLCPAPIKKAHFDYMLEKTTELGATHIQPMLTYRTQIREVNVERAHAIAREAAEQSERLSIPKIHSPVTLTDLIKTCPEDRLMLCCAEFGEAEPIAQCLEKLRISDTVKAAILTGPEGGFTREELASLRERKNTHFLRLGPRILRADTAAIAALSIWQSLCGDWTKPLSPDR